MYLIRRDEEKAALEGYLIAGYYALKVRAGCLPFAGDYCTRAPYVQSCRTEDAPPPPPSSPPPIVITPGTQWDGCRCLMPSFGHAAELTARVRSETRRTSIWENTGTGSGHAHAGQGAHSPHLL